MPKVDSSRPLAPLSNDEWVDLHKQADGIFVSDCWKHCNSYCCKTNHETQDFSLMKCGSAGMVFPKQEFDFLKDNGLLQVGHGESAREWEFVIDADRGLSAKFVTAHCDLGGLCSNAEWRPLICKFYPLYPVVEPETQKVESYTFGSIIDQYWEQLKVKHPCWLYRNHEEEIDKTIRTEMSPALVHPYMIFYLNAANIIVNQTASLADTSAANTKVNDPRQFFRQWEISYFTGKLFDVPDLKKELTELYDTIVEHCGPFET